MIHKLGHAAGALVGQQVIEGRFQAICGRQLFFRMLHHVDRMAERCVPAEQDVHQHRFLETGSGRF